MLHYIIVKWKKGSPEGLADRVRELYRGATTLSGIRSVEIRENITPRDNRYDLMVILHMEEGALPTWDSSDLHQKWKADFGAYIEKKCIFDCNQAIENPRGGAAPIAGK